MHQENPYTAPSTDTLETPRKPSPFRVMAWWLVYLSPLTTLGMIYLCWVLTCISLDRKPTFGEHPISEPFHLIYHVLGIVAAITLLASPIIIFAGMVWSLAQPFARARSAPLLRRLACFVIFAMMVALVAGLLHVDPIGVFYWFAD